MKYLIIILGLVSLFFVAHSAVAQDMGVTASEVVDRETLKAFVEGAKDSLESTANFAEVARLVEVFRSEGDWKAGSIYIFVINTDGVVFFHGADPSLYQSYELTLYSRPFSRTQFFDRIVACCIGIPRLTACQNNGIISLKTPIG